MVLGESLNFCLMIEIHLTQILGSNKARARKIWILIGLTIWKFGIWKPINLVNNGKTNSALKAMKNEGIVFRIFQDLLAYRLIGPLPCFAKFDYFNN